MLTNSPHQGLISWLVATVNLIGTGCMASGAWDGTLTAEEFQRSALRLVSAWERWCPDLPQWAWRTSEKTVLSTVSGHVCGYLLLEDVRVSSDREDDVESFHESDDGDDVEDHATMHVGSLGVHEQHLYTYHVIYNESYRVPMLFLRGRLQDGRPLQWDSVLRDLPVGSQQVSDQSRWTFLTQEDHPLLHRPWFALHPCGTSEIMRLVFSDLFLQGKKDTVSVSEQLEESSGISERQATCEPLLGRAEIATSDRSVKWEDSEARLASCVENTFHKVLEMESSNRLETSYKRIKSLIYWQPRGCCIERESGVLYCIFGLQEGHVVKVVTGWRITVVGVTTCWCGHSWRFSSTKSKLPQQFERRPICRRSIFIKFFSFKKRSQDGRC